jgi:hypothetical protein
MFGDDRLEYRDWRDRGKSKKAGKIAHDPSKHYPNKNEAELLRHLMATTGLSEEELRDLPKYRRMLSDAQKMGVQAKRSAEEKIYAALVKQACRETKLAKEHPETLRVLQRIVDNLPVYAYRVYVERLDFPNLTAEIIVRSLKK